MLSLHLILRILRLFLNWLFSNWASSLGSRKTPSGLYSFCISPFRLPFFFPQKCFPPLAVTGEYNIYSDPIRIKRQKASGAQWLRPQVGAAHCVYVGLERRIHIFLQRKKACLSASVFFFSNYDHELLDECEESKAGFWAEKSKGTPIVISRATSRIYGLLNRPHKPIYISSDIEL